ncbi:MAG: methyltransferase domain-containing protein [Candidatus Lokiarchaeota archaeon]|nr:methyltransferase domain-containing protein [Candidatus Lokiarchaeota archaeon]
MQEKDKYDRIYAGNFRYPNTNSLYGSLCHGANVIKFIDQLDFDTVLDIGCGRAQFASLMLKRGKKVSACDISQSLIDQLSISGVKFVCCPMSDIKFNCTFDLVTAFDVLEHIPEDLIDQSLLELRRVTGKHAIVSVAWHEDEKWGMDLHVTVKDESWWYDKLNGMFDINIIQRKPHGMFVYMK